LWVMHTQKKKERREFGCCCCCCCFKIAKDKATNRKACSNWLITSLSDTSKYYVVKHHLYKEIKESRVITKEGKVAPFPIVFQQHTFNSSRFGSAKNCTAASFPQW
jgi:hypothetical protein